MKNIEESTYFHEKYEKLQKVCIVCDFVKIIILGILMVFYITILIDTVCFYGDILANAAYADNNSFLLAISDFFDTHGDMSGFVFLDVFVTIMALMPFVLNVLLAIHGLNTLHNFQTVGCVCNKMKLDFWFRAIAESVLFLQCIPMQFENLSFHILMIFVTIIQGLGIGCCIPQYQIMKELYYRGYYIDDSQV